VCVSSTRRTLKDLGTLKEKEKDGGLVVTKSTDEGKWGASIFFTRRQKGLAPLRRRKSQQ
jgi:hypothetical protein